MMQTRCKCVANMVNAVFTSLLHRACKCVSKYGIYHVCHTFAPRLQKLMIKYYNMTRYLELKISHTKDFTGVIADSLNVMYTKRFKNT